MTLQTSPQQTSKQASNRYQNSEELLERALKVIPLGTQTFSKSQTQYPKGVSPFYIDRAQGSRVWDVDNNEYIDFINSLAAITLGYNDPDVTLAVAEQLKKGVIFSLPHRLEIEVAEKISEMVPCAEKVRFGKNGSDATAGCVRVARAFTRRDHVAVCGYHGWQDWYIGSTPRNLGVPQATRDLTHSFTYNDIDSLQKIFKGYEVAAVIMEPSNLTMPQKDFLKEVQEVCKKQGALFILDETVTGFRYANGGAQEYFGVTPDLAAFGKGLANGYPLSAVAGKAEYMKLMEDIFFSFTFGGEALSLAAALAALRKLQAQPVVRTLKERGEEILEKLPQIVNRYELQNVLTLTGHPAWSFLTIRDTKDYSQWQIKTLFLQEMFARGILILGTHNISFSHSKDDIEKLLSAYDGVFKLISESLKDRNLEQRLKCKPLEPLFKIR